MRASLNPNPRSLGHTLMVFVLAAVMALGFAGTALSAVPGHTNTPCAVVSPGIAGSAHTTAQPTVSTQRSTGDGVRLDLAATVASPFAPSPKAGPAAGGVRYCGVDLLGQVRSLIQSAVNWLRCWVGNFRDFAVRIGPWIASNLRGRYYYYWTGSEYCVENRGILNMPIGSTCYVNSRREVRVNVFWGN